MTDAWTLDFGGDAQLIPAQMAPRDKRLNDRIERRVETEANRQQGVADGPYTPPAGYTVKPNEDHPELPPYVYDDSGMIADTQSLRKNYGEVERLYRQRPTPEQLRDINRWRGALGMPGTTHEELIGQPAKPQAPSAPVAPSMPDAAPDAWSQDFGAATPPKAAAPIVAPKAADPNAEPDAKTWIGRRIQDVRGKQDPRYAGIPNIARVLQDEGGHQIAPEVWAWGTGASDKDMAGVYGPMLGNRLMRQEMDANGYPVVVYKGKDGSEQKAYVNSPGIDMQDVARGAYGAIPYAVGGLAANAMLKGAPLLGRMGGQGIAQAGASLAQDAAGVATGVSELDLKQSAVKAGLSAGFGAAGEAAGAAGNALMRKLSVEPSLFENGALTAKGIKAAQDAGIDPTLLTGQSAQDFAKAFARSGNAGGAFTEATSKEFKIPRTLGELNGDKNQLLREQQYRGGTYGNTAQERIKEFDTKQSDAIKNALTGEIAPGKPGIAGQIAPARAGEALKRADMGANIKANTTATQDAAKEKVREAWSKVQRVDATPEALAELDGTIRSGVKDIMIDADVTPMAAKMSRALDEFKAGKAPSKAAEILPDNTIGDVGNFRKRLLSIYQSAEKPEDKRAARAIYDAYNDWIPIAAEKAGDPGTAIAMRTARGISREVHEAFEAGRNDAGGRIMQNILKKTDYPEGIITELFSAPGKSEIRNGSTSAISSLFKAYDKYLPAEAAQTAKNDIRLAYLDRMVNMKTGEKMTPGKLQTALKTARNNQASLYNFLFDEGERRTLARLEQAMSGIEKKNPNTSWSAIGAGALMRDIGSAIYTMIGGNSATKKIIANGLYNRAEKTLGGFAASKATGGGMGAQVPSLPAPSYGWAGGAYGSRTDNR